MRGATANQDFRYGTDDVIPAAPRIFPDDPPGYSPIVWLHDVVVPADPPYVFGSYKKLSDIDPAKITPRDTATTVWTKNFPMAGFASKCVTDDAVRRLRDEVQQPPRSRRGLERRPHRHEPAGPHDQP